MEAVFAAAKNRHSLVFCSNTKITSRLCNVGNFFIFHALVFSAVNKQGLPSVVSILTHCVKGLTEKPVSQSDLPMAILMATCSKMKLNLREYLYSCSCLYLCNGFTFYMLNILFYWKIDSEPQFKRFSQNTVFSVLVLHFLHKQTGWEHCTNLVIVHCGCSRAAV